MEDRENTDSKKIEYALGVLETTNLLLIHKATKYCIAM